MKNKLNALLYRIFSYINNERPKEKEFEKLKDIPVETEQEVRACNAWMKKVGVSKLYTQFEAFEDPNIILDVPSIATQLKIDRIKECHRQYQKSIEQ